MNRVASTGQALRPKTRSLLNESRILLVEPGGALTVLIFNFAPGLEIDENLRKVVHIRAVQDSNLFLVPWSVTYMVESRGNLQSSLLSCARYMHPVDS